MAVEFVEKDNNKQKTQKISISMQCMENIE